MKYHTINMRDNVMMDVMRSTFDISSAQMKNEIQGLARQTVEALRERNVDYSALKSALVPQNRRKEVGLVFDSAQISSGWYGLEVIERVLPLLNKKSSSSILLGDILGENHQQVRIRDALRKELIEGNCYKYQNSTQFYVVYINNLPEAAVGKLHEKLLDYPPFAGSLRFERRSFMKLVLACSLCNSFVAHRGSIIQSHEDDEEERLNQNTLGYPFEDYGFKNYSIKNMLFSHFLSYKIERPYHPEETETELLLNAICEQPSSLISSSVQLDDAKLGYLLKEKKASLDRAGLSDWSSKEIGDLIQRNLRSNYVYNLEYLEQHNTIKFNIRVEVEAESGLLFHLVVALKYLPEENLVKVITLY